MTAAQKKQRAKERVRARLHIDMTDRPGDTNDDEGETDMYAYMYADT